MFFFYYTKNPYSGIWDQDPISENRKKSQKKVQLFFWNYFSTGKNYVFSMGFFFKFISWFRRIVWKRFQNDSSSLKVGELALKMFWSSDTMFCVVKKKHSYMIDFSEVEPETIENETFLIIFRPCLKVSLERLYWSVPFQILTTPTSERIDC